MSTLIDKAVTAAGLRARYSQAHRRYHTLGHVENVLLRIEELSPRHTDLLPIQLAAWFHDAIYAPSRDDNEERSAFLARDTLELVGASPALGTEVARLVILTASHDPTAQDMAGAVLSDADLSILGSSPDDYTRYATAVREEYAFIPDATFCVGRARILRTLLTRPSLYRTEIGQQRWEKTARLNIHREVGSLEGGDP